MTRIDGMQGTFGVLKRSTGTGSGNNGSRSPVDQGTVQSNGELCRQHQSNDVGATARHLRVCFIDEVLGLTPQELVTSTAFRPPTTSEEKSLLYYTSQDYALFAREDYYRQVEMIQCQSKGLGWEDCMVHEGEHGHEIHSEEKRLGWEDCMVHEGEYGHEIHNEEKRLGWEDCMVHEVDYDHEIHNEEKRLGWEDCMVHEGEYGHEIHNQEKRLGWEDCMVREGEYGHEINSEEKTSGGCSR